MTKEYNITPVLDVEKKLYAIQNYDEVLDACKNFIANELSGVNLNELNNDTFKEVKAIRTEIRKRSDLIKRTRIDISKLALDLFNSQAKELERLLNETDAQLKEYVDRYSVEIVGKPEKLPMITLLVKGSKEEDIKKVSEYARKLGLECQIK